MKKKSRLIKKIITFIGSFISAISVIASLFPSAFAMIPDVPNVDKVVFVLVVVLLWAMSFLNWKQTVDENDYKLETEHKTTHRYAHLLRDTTYEAKRLNPNGNNDALAMHLLTTFANGAVDCVETALIALSGADPTNGELMVCVKILDMQYWDNTAIEDKTQVTFRTLSRSITPKGALQADDAKSHEITGCTAFYRIFVEGKHDWTGINLNKKKNIQIISEDELQIGSEYRDTCTNWQDSYKHRIVVPIRVKLSEIDSAFQNSDERNLFGFLCVEYKRKDLFKISDKDDSELISICDFLKTYADTMYIMFDNIYKGMSFSK